jgi:hypothetical protein
MTDTHGNEPHDHDSGHDEFLIHEQDAVHELPTEDEFADHSATVAEEQNEDHTSAATGAKSGHRSPLLPIAAAVGGVLLLGAVAWWQFGGGNAPSQPMTLSIPTTPPTTNVAARAASAAVAPTPDLPVAATTSDPAATPVAAMAPMTPMAPADQAPQMAVPTDTPSSHPLPSSVGGSTPNAMPAPVDQRIDALSTRLDDLQRSLDQTTQQLGQLTNMISATASSPSGKDLQDRLDKMEQQIASLHPSAPKLTAPMTLSGDAPVATHLQSVKSTSSKTHHSVLKANASHTTVAKKAEPAPASWVLRSASSGQAWVSASPTAHDLKQVQVGDNLAGIGQVTAIVQNNGNWIVQGTKGVIQ